MKKRMKIVMSLALCFGLALSQFSYIGASRQTVSITKSQSTATSGTCVPSEWGWYTASNGVTSTAILVARPQEKIGGNWNPVVGGFVRDVHPGSNETINGFPGNNGSGYRLHLSGAKRCIGNGIIRDA